MNSRIALQKPDAKVGQTITKTVKIIAAMKTFHSKQKYINELLIILICTQSQTKLRNTSES